MTFVVADRVQETSTTTGTGAFTLAGAAAGFQSFADIGDGNTCPYSIEDGTDWETGIGTYTAAGTLLTRTTVVESSNGDAAVNWGAGTKTVRCSPVGSKDVFTDQTQTLTNKTLEEPLLTGSHGTNVLTVESVPTSVNYVHMTNAATGGTPTIKPVGTDTNIDLHATAKGSGQVRVSNCYIETYIRFANVGTLAPLRITERNSPTTNEVEHDIYLDDGTNTASGSPGFRRYNGAAWEDVGAVGGAGISNVVEDTTPQLGGNIDAQGNDITNVGALELNNATELTIATGSVTKTQAFHSIDTEADAASDILATINGGSQGDLAFIHPISGSRTVILDHGAGNIVTPNGEDVSLEAWAEFALLLNDGTNWQLLTHNKFLRLQDDTTPGLGGDLDFNAVDAHSINQLRFSGTKPLNIAPAASAPGSPNNNDIYFDDGTNTSSGFPNFRYYHSGDASWYEFGWEGPVP